VIVARDGMPAAAERPQHGQVGLFECLLTEAVARSYQLAGAGPVLQGGTGDIHLAGIFAPARVRAGAALPQGGSNVAHQLGAARSQGVAGEADQAVAKIMNPADSGIEPFPSGLRIDEAGDQRSGEMVRIADAIGAIEAVVPEELTEVEVGNA